MANRRRLDPEDGQLPQLVVQIQTDEPRTSTQIQRGLETSDFVTKNDLEKLEKRLVEK
jgi:hypothetical protein